MTTYSFVGVADGTLLEDAYPDFFKITGSNTNAITINGEKADFTHSSTGSGAACLVVDAESTDHYCRVVYGSNYVGSFFPCIVRCVDYRTYISARVADGNVLQLYSVVANTQTLLYSRTVSRTSADEIELRAVGDNFLLYFNGVLEEETPGDGYTATKITTTHDASTLAGMNVRSASQADAVAEVEIAASASAPSINPTGTDTTAYPGQSRSCVLQNVVATPTAVAYVYTPAEGDPIVSTHTDFDWTAGAGGAGVITYTVAQGNLPYGNTNLSIRVSFESGDPVTLSGMALTVESGFAYVVLGDDLLTGEPSVVENYTGDAPAENMQIRYPLLTEEGGEFVVYPDTSHGVISYPGATPASDSIELELWDFEEWRPFTYNVDLSGGEPGTPTIETVGTVRIGGTAAITVSGFSGSVNAGTLDGVALTSAGDTSITVPALADTVESPRPGTRTLTVTDGVDSDSEGVHVGAPTGWSYYTITAEFAESINGVANAFLPDGAAAEDFILYPSPKNNVSDSGIGTSFVGTQEFFLLSNTTKIATAFSVVTGAGASGFGGSASQIPGMQVPTMRGLS